MKKYETENGVVKSVIFDCLGKEMKIECDAVVLCCGASTPYHIKDFLPNADILPMIAGQGYVFDVLYDKL